MSASTQTSDSLEAEVASTNHGLWRLPWGIVVSIQRIVEPIEQSESLRTLSKVLSPIYVDVGYHEMSDGMKIEAVFDGEVIEIMVSQYAEKATETIRTGIFDVYVHQGVPFELFILDDRIGMAAHDEDGVA